MIKDKMWCQLCGRSLGYFVISERPDHLGFYCEKCDEVICVGAKKIQESIDNNILKAYEGGYV